MESATGLPRRLTRESEARWIAELWSRHAMQSVIVDALMRIRLTPRVKLRARPAPSQLNCDTSYIQLLNTDLRARQLQRLR